MAASILVVEDDEGVQEAILLTLELGGHQTCVAVDGHEALRRIEEARPDLMVLDLMLPRMNGYELIAELERRQLRSDMKILVLTADAGARPKAEQIGADGGMVKPFDVDDLLAEVERLLAL